MSGLRRQWTAGWSRRCSRSCRPGGSPATRRTRTRSICCAGCRTRRSPLRPSVSEPALSPFSYAVLRVVPRVERGERFNAGVVLFCRQLDFLGVKVGLDERRLAALAADMPADEVRAHLEALAR